MGLSDKLREAFDINPSPNSKLGKALAADGVGRSAEWRRIRDLPRRILTFDESVPDLTPLWLRLSNCPGCEICRKGPPSLRPVQSAMLLEAERAGGLLAPVGVGCGKELACLLLPDALDSKRAVLLTKARLKRQLLEVDAPRYGRHFRVRRLLTLADLPRAPKGLGDPKLPKEERKHLMAQGRASFNLRLPEGSVVVVSYSELQHPNHAFALLLIRPDLYVCNEAHALKNRSSARTKRFMAALREDPAARACYLSGTMAKDTTRDYAHFSESALRARSPLPAGHQELQQWSRGLDVPKARDAESAPMDPGALLDLCGGPALADELDQLPASDQELFALGLGEAARAVRRQVARRIFHRRLTETPGVVARPSGGGCDASLVIQAREVAVPEVILEALASLRRDWAIGDDAFAEAAIVAEKSRQLASGFYYRVVWPGGVVDHEWLAARKAWCSRSRHILTYQSRAGRDSELLAMRAVQRGEVDGPELAPWLAVRDRWPKGPPREAVWLSEFLVDDVAAWCAQRTDDEAGIVWYQHRELGDRLKARGLNVDMDEREILDYRGAHVVASLSSFTDGLNLQHFNRMYYAEVPANCPAFEQSLGRAHRPGQEADEVVADVAVHDEVLRRALSSAVAEAHFAEKSEPKLLLAQKIGLDWLDAG